MSKPLLLTLAAVCFTFSISHVSAQDLTAWHAAQMAQTNAYGEAMINQFVQSNMQNPYVQQQYRVYQQQGGTLDFPSYCYRYSETGGMTKEGTERAMRAYRDIHARDQANYNAYAEWSRRLWQDTNDYRSATQDKWAEQRGEILNGQSTYVNDSNGSAWQLPNTASPGQMFQDRSTGNYFYMDPHGQYWMNNGQGWQSMQYKYGE